MWGKCTLVYQAKSGFQDPWQGCYQSRGLLGTYSTSRTSPHDDQDLDEVLNYNLLPTSTRVHG